MPRQGSTSGLELELACDLASMGAVKAGRPPPGLPARATGHGLAWELPGRCSVVASGSPGPATADPASGVMAWDIQVQPSRPATSSGPGWPARGRPRSTVRCRPPRRPGPRRRGGSRRSPAAAAYPAQPGRPGGTELSGGGAARRHLRRRGAPWYLTLFGRDSIWAARMLLPLGTDLALGTLHALARRQGRSSDGVTGEQPGRDKYMRCVAPHDEGTPAGQSRSNPSPRRPPASLPPIYYGTVDATPLWACLLYDAWKWGAPEAEVVALLRPLQRCLTWLANLGRGPYGFVSYIDESGRGLVNQGWKDLATVFSSGTVVSPAPRRPVRGAGLCLRGRPRRRRTTGPRSGSAGPTAGGSSPTAWPSGSGPGSGWRTTKALIPPSPYREMAARSTRSRPTSGTCSGPAC